MNGLTGSISFGKQGELREITIIIHISHIIILNHCGLIKSLIKFIKIEKAIMKFLIGLITFFLNNMA